MLDPLEVQALSEELWELSEHEEQNMKRMKEIAHILVQHYLYPNYNKDGMQEMMRKEEVKEKPVQ